MSLKERLFAKAALPEEIVEVEGEQFLIVGLSARARNDWVAAGQKPGVDLSKKLDGEVLAQLEAELVILCTHDPATREPVFERADRDRITELPGAVVAELANPARRLSGLDRKEGEEKND